MRLASLATPWIICSILLTGCGLETTEAQTGKPILVINDLQLTAQELRDDVTSSALPSHLRTAEQGEEPAWLDLVIERELLVQEAQRRGLDRQPAFMKTIERFWKEALIKSLIERQANELTAKIEIYEPEIEAYYQQWASDPQSAQGLEPYAAMRDEIRRTLREQKEMEAMEQWVAGLRAQARIEVDREAVATIP